MSDPVAGYLEIGTDGEGQVIINLDKDRTGHLIFSSRQARQLARTLNDKADEADNESLTRHYRSWSDAVS